MSVHAPAHETTVVQFIEEATRFGFDVAGIGEREYTQRRAMSNEFPDADADHAYLAALR